MIGDKSAHFLHSTQPKQVLSSHHIAPGERSESPLLRDPKRVQVESSGQQQAAVLRLADKSVKTVVRGDGTRALFEPSHAPQIKPQRLNYGISLKRSIDRSLFESRSLPRNAFSLCFQPKIKNNIAYFLTGRDFVSFSIALGIDQSKEAFHHKLIPLIKTALRIPEYVTIGGSSLSAPPREVLDQLRKDLEVNCQRWVFFKTPELNFEASFGHMADDHKLKGFLIQRVQEVHRYHRALAGRNEIGAILSVFVIAHLLLGKHVYKKSNEKYYSGGFETEGWKFSDELKKYVKTREEEFYSTPIRQLFHPQYGSVDEMPQNPDGLWFEELFPFHCFSFFLAMIDSTMLHEFIESIKEAQRAKRAVYPAVK